MRTLLPVRWSEGMFLKPQHFQQADLFQDGRLAVHLRAMNPFHWGISRLRVDPDALENMLFRVDRCEVVMPDGVVIDFPEAAELDEASFQEEFPATARSLGVFLAIRSLNPELGVSERFASLVATRRDLLFRDNEAAIDFHLPKARIVFAEGIDDDRLNGFEALKIAEVRRTGRTAPRFELAPTYFPPALTIHATSGLASLVNLVMERLCGAARLYGQHLRERGPEALGYGVGDLEQLLARQLISQMIPPLQSAVKNEAAHPYGVYVHLCETFGGLTSFFPDEEAWSFPDYDHTDLAGCFGAVCEDIRRLLERLLPVHYLEFTLQRDHFHFTTPLDESVFSRGDVFVLALAGAAGEEDLAQRIETQAKLSSIQDMVKLVNYADRGAPLRYMGMPPAEIPRLANHAYFQVDTRDVRFRPIKSDGSFDFYLADAEPELAGRLYVILREAERGGR